MERRSARRREESLRDALIAATEIIAWAKTRTFTDYTDDKFLRYAIERQFEILGELLNAAAREDENLRQIVPEIGEFIGLRNVIAHAYFRIDDGLIWSAIQADVPVIRARIMALLGEEDAPPATDSE